jgi:hypothetical protein
VSKWTGMASEADIVNLSSNMVTCSGLCLIIELVSVAFFRIILQILHFSLLLFSEWLPLSQEDSRDSPCEQGVGEVGEEMPLWTGGRTKARRRLWGRFRSLSRIWRTWCGRQPGSSQTWLSLSRWSLQQAQPCHHLWHWIQVRFYSLLKFLLA